VRIREHAEVVEPDVLDKRLERFELVGGLAGEPDDERGPEGDPGDPRSDPVQEAPVGGAGTGTSHPFQDTRRRVLQRQVDVLADLVALRHRVQHVVGDRGGVEVEHPDPLEAVDPVQAAEEPREGSPLAAIHAEERRVLGDEQQFAHAAIRQAPGLGEDRLRFAAAVVAAQRRDDAKRAVVAAFSHLDVA
jgi:hypothetical protein